MGRTIPGQVIFIPNEGGTLNLANSTILTPENLEEPLNGSFFGNVLANIGDISNDGHDDLGVGANLASIRDMPRGGGSGDGDPDIEGVVFIYLSSNDGTFDFNNHFILSAPIETVNGSYSFGVDVKGLGDINRDGIDDFAVITNRGDIFADYKSTVDPNTTKITTETGVASVNDTANNGVVFIYFGNSG